MIKPNHVFISRIKKKKYPQDNHFNPHKKYPEYPFGNSIADKPNYIYKEIRNIFKNLELDIKNFGSKEWNPLKYFIKPGQNILIKPNFVFHSSPAKLVCTHPSLIRAVTDYCIIALKGKGQIIIGDSPLQSCNFEKLIIENKLMTIIDFYKKKKATGRNLEILIRDFRLEKLEINTGPLGARIKRRLKKLEGDPDGYKIVNLKDLSSLYPIRQDFKRFRVTDYNSKIMNYSHNKNDNKYLIPNSVLKSDVVIEMPKIKTHKKAGITACLKNNVGINGRKDFLPHHREGSVQDGGDEYHQKNIFKYLLTKLDSFTTNLHNYNNLDYFYLITSFLRGILLQIINNFGKDKTIYGNWYGNDTIWRTIIDLNKILFYSDKEGKIKKEKQRKTLYICDGVYAGEKKGPIQPSLRKAGIVIFGINPVMIDLAISRILGFNYRKIPMIKEAFNQKTLRLTNYDPNNLTIFSNRKYWNHKKLTEIKKTLNFIPPPGWKNI